ncbi:hypothetical protein Fmac_020060 [Flemingia macrophylla]|uniref:Uncharacterized protein n=1 Tax=Flemingia macrophylla TaxID=520843 RepID=A0ABD1M9R9_9FABA
MAVSEMGKSWWVLCDNHYRQKVKPPNTPLCLQIPSPPIRCRCRRVVAGALDPKTEDKNSTSPSKEVEDLVYVGKVVAGSLAGGAVIKYGSALFPQITTPNLLLALLIILTPLLLALFLLIKESRTNS